MGSKGQGWQQFRSSVGATAASRRVAGITSSLGASVRGVRSSVGEQQKLGGPEAPTKASELRTELARWGGP